MTLPSRKKHPITQQNMSPEETNPKRKSRLLNRLLPKREVVFLGLFSVGIICISLLTSVSAEDPIERLSTRSPTSRWKELRREYLQLKQKDPNFEIDLEGLTERQKRKYDRMESRFTKRHRKTNEKGFERKSSPIPGAKFVNSRSKTVELPYFPKQTPRIRKSNQRETPRKVIVRKTESTPKAKPSFFEDAEHGTFKIVRRPPTRRAPVADIKVADKPVPTPAKIAPPKPDNQPVVSDVQIVQKAIPAPTVKPVLELPFADIGKEILSKTEIPKPLQPATIASKPFPSEPIINPFAAKVIEPPAMSQPTALQPAMAQPAMEVKTVEAKPQPPIEFPVQFPTSIPMNEPTNQFSQFEKTPSKAPFKASPLPEQIASHAVSKSKRLEWISVKSNTLAADPFQQTNVKLKTLRVPNVIPKQLPKERLPKEIPVFSTKDILITPQPLAPKRPARFDTKERTLLPIKAGPVDNIQSSIDGNMDNTICLVEYLQETDSEQSSKKKSKFDSALRWNSISTISPFEDYEPNTKVKKQNRYENVRNRPDGKVVKSDQYAFPKEAVLSEELYSGRYFPESAYYWTASNLHYHPLYFEDVQLERYGHDHHKLIQPIYSLGKFSAQLAGLPYQWVLHSPDENVYPLGYYQPGDPAPRLVHQVPLNGEAAAVTAGVYTGLIFLFP